MLGMGGMVRVRDHVGIRVWPIFTLLSQSVLHSAVPDPTRDCGHTVRILLANANCPRIQYVGFD